jgi:GH35 family endo-1,4-beta-xylanase
MKTKSRGVLLALLLAASSSRAADLPEIYHTLWSDPAVAARIESGIEKHRKGDAVIEVVGKDGKPLANATVEVRQQTHEFLFGCNLFVLDQLATPELNRKYEAAFTNLFNFATLPFYWRELEPEPGKPRFAEDSPRIWRRPPPDRLVKWCKANGITPKGHALMYAKTKFMPDWTARDDPKTFLQQSAKHMAEIAARYGRDIPIWDAVNEEMPRRIHFKEWHAVPDDYLAWCFQEAGRLFPKDVKLLINDGQLQAHYDTYDYMGLVKDLQQRGARVEGIGIQFHISRDSVLGGKLYTPAHLQDVYSQLGRLGLPLYITEITVPGVGESGAELQAAIVANIYRLWFSTPAMAGVTWWNLGDGTAYENENKALGGLLDAEMNPKPAYRELDRLINHDWKTRLTLKTDANGRACFRGFCGSYSYTAEVGDKKSAGVFRLQRNAKNHISIKP